MDHRGIHHRITMYNRTSVSSLARRELVVQGTVAVVAAVAEATDWADVVVGAGLVDWGLESGLHCC